MSLENNAADYRDLDSIINADVRYDLNKILFFAKTDDGTLVIPDISLFDMYFAFAKNYIVTYKSTSAQVQFYRYRPHLLSLDVYGTPYLAWMILKLNDRDCPSKFYLKNTVKLIPADALVDAYDVISTKSGARLSANQNRYLSQVGEEI